jgi:hypothetical protein
MAITQNELDDFHRFASQRLGNGGGELSLPELVDLWMLEHPSTAEQAEVKEIVRQGNADIESGNYRSIDQFMDDFRRKHNIPADS